jgi:hypothetical protein
MPPFQHTCDGRAGKSEQIAKAGHLLYCICAGFSANDFHAISRGDFARAREET